MRREEKRFYEEREKKEKLVLEIFNKFDVKIPLLSWAGMSLPELRDIYDELAEQQ